MYTNNVWAYYRLYINSIVVRYIIIVRVIGMKMTKNQRQYYFAGRW